LTEFCSENDANYPKLRTAKDHQMHISAVLNDAQLASVYGVNKEAALHSLASFDLRSYLPPDLFTERHS
jgi:hypothetical protein